MLKKNIVIADKSTEILYVSTTYPGSVHDKKIADEQGFEFEKTIILLQDTGFQGYAPENAVIVQPVKKPKGKELTPEQKTENKQKSSRRIYVEHAIGGFKIWRVAKDVCRTWVDATRDIIVFIAAGLHNLRLKCRQKGKKANSV